MADTTTQKKTTAAGRSLWLTESEGAKCTHVRHPLKFEYDLLNSKKETLTVHLTAETDMPKRRDAKAMPDLVISIGSCVAPFFGSLLTSGAVESPTLAIPDDCQATCAQIHLAWAPRMPYPLPHIVWAVVTAIEYMQDGNDVEIISETGHERLPTFVACLLMYACNISPAEALKVIRQLYCKHALVCSGTEHLLTMLQLFQKYNDEGTLLELIDWGDTPTPTAAAAALPIEGVVQETKTTTSLVPAYSTP